jgi:hypothetical protein
LVPFLALTPVLVGCGADCEDVCEKARECPGADDDDDCGKICEDAESLSEAAGCEDEFDDYISCIDDEDDICADSGDLSDVPCRSEGLAHLACVEKYCDAHASDAACM